MNLEAMTDEELAEIAGISLGSPIQDSIDKPNLEAMSDEELARMAGLERDVPSTGEYLWNEAKMAPTFLPVMGGSFAEYATEDRDIPPEDMVWLPSDATNLQKASALWDGVTKQAGYLAEHIREWREKAGEVVGADPTMEAPSQTAKVLGGGISAALDPASYIGAPLKAGQVVVSVGKQSLKYAKEMGEALFAGMGATYGGDVGEEVGGTTGQVIGTITGAMAPAVAPTRSLKTVATKTLKIGKSFHSGKDVTGVQGAAARKFLTALSEEQGIDDIVNTVDDLRKAGMILNRKETPLFVAMSDSPVVREELISLAKTHPEFMHRVTNELMGIHNKISSHYDNVLGARYAQIGDPELYTKSQNTAIKKATKRRMKIDKTISEADMQLIPPQQRKDLGRKIASMVKVKRAAVTQELSPAYTKLTEEAMSAGAVMPSDAVASIYTFVKQNRTVRDIFGKGTALDRKVMSLIKPRRKAAETKATSIYGQTVTKDVSQTEFPEMTFEQVDSLKRALNEAGRKKMTQNEMRLLNDLKGVVSEARKRIGGDFNDRLISLDTLYHQKVGIPFSEQGVVDLSSRKYAEQIAPVLTDKRSALDGFLNVAGEEGVEVARNAILSKAYHTSGVVKDGVLNPKGLRAFIKKNSEVIDAIPNLRNDLNAMQENQSNLMLAVGRLDEAVKVQQNDVANHFINHVSRTTRVPDYGTMVRGMLNKEIRIDEILKNIKTLDAVDAKAVRGSLRRELVEIAGSNPNGVHKFLASPENRSISRALLGDRHYKMALDLSKMHDVATRADVSKLTSLATRGEPISLLGVDITNIVATIRRPIVSWPQKGLILVSKIWTAGRQAHVDKVMMEVLSSPDGIEQLHAFAKKATKGTFNTKGVTDSVKQSLLMNAAGLAPMQSYVATKTLAKPEEETKFREAQAEVVQ